MLVQVSQVSSLVKAQVQSLFNFFKGLLNDFDGASAAYSLRRLGSYNSSVLRIRRASDNVEVNVAFNSANAVGANSPISNVVNEFLSNDFNAWQSASSVNVTSSSSFTASAGGQGVQLSVPTGTKVKVTGAGTVTGAVVQLYDWSNGGNKQNLSGSFSFSTTFTISGDQQKIYFRSAGATSINFTSLTVEKVNDPADTATTTLGAFLTEEVTGYSSDFSTTNGWQGSSTLVSANVDANADGAGVPPSDDFLKMVANPRLSIRDNSVVDNFVIGAGGGVFNVTFDYYAPQDISTFKVIVFSSSGNPQFGDNNQIVAGSGSFSATVTLTDAQAQTLSDFRVGSTTDQTGKTLYIKNLQIKRSNHTATVHTWYDQSGNGKDATQDTSGEQPKIAESGNIVTKLGKASIDFTTSKTFLENSSVSITETDVSYFSVWQPAFDGATSNEAKNRTLFTISSNGTFIQTPNTADQMQWKRLNATNPFALAVANLNTPNLHSAIGTSSGANYYFNSSSIYSDSLTGSNTTRTGLRIGTRILVDSHHTTGYISEFLIYNSDQSLNRFKIESNINNHYGIYTAANDGFVKTWYDQSGNGNDASQPTKLNQPKIVNSGSLTTQGGKPCLDFDGVNDVLQFSAPDVQSGNIRSLFITCSAPTSQNKSVMGTDSEYLIKRDSSRAISQNNLGASRLNSAFTFSGTTTHLVTVIRNYTASSSSLSLDGDVDATRTDSYGLSSVHQIGGKKSGSNIIEESDFNCLEVVVYASDQTANRTAIEANIANQYNLNLS